MFLSSYEDIPICCSFKKGLSAFLLIPRKSVIRSYSINCSLKPVYFINWCENCAGLLEIYCAVLVSNSISVSWACSVSKSSYSNSADLDSTMRISSGLIMLSEIGLVITTLVEFYPATFLLTAMSKWPSVRRAKNTSR